MENQFAGIDNGRIRMEDYQGILYCDAYMDDEFRVEDVQSMVEQINRHYHGKSDIILRKTGSYSVSIEAQILLTKGVREFANFVYIVDTEVKRESAEYAAQTYMTAYHAQVASSREQAYAMLQRRARR